MLLAHAKQLKDAQTNCASWVVLLRRYFEKAIHNEDDLLTTLKPQLPSSILIDLYTYTMVASGYVIVVYLFDFFIHEFDRNLDYNMIYHKRKQSPL